MDIKKLELVDPSCSLTIGNEFQATNKIEFKLELSATVEEVVVLMLKIPVGDTGVLRQDTDSDGLSIKVKKNSSAQGAQDDAESLNPTPVRYDDAQTPTENAGNTTIEKFKAYYLGSGQGVEVHGAVEYQISIEKILCNAAVGDAKIKVEARKPEKEDTAPADHSKEVTVKKKQPTSSEVTNPILYFIAEPSYVIGKGNVTLSWSVVSPQKIKLRTPSHPDGEYVTSNSSHTDYLAKTSTYKLEIESDKHQTRETTVNVVAEQGNWSGIIPEPSQRLSTFPSVVFYPQQTDEALYIINCGLKINRGLEGKTVTTVTRGLYKSADGITNWMEIAKWVPKGMESSPGLKLGKRLWLIGGSSVDPDQKSDRIWYFDLDKTVWRSVELKYTSGDRFEKRMGHACVAVPEDRFCVLGGLGEFEALNDVWEFTIKEPKDNELLSVIEAHQLQPHDSEKSSCRWKPRCMFTAVRVGREIWVCGGFDSTYGNRAGDVWTCEWPLKPNTPPNWTQSKSEDVGKAVATGADVCGKSMFLVVQDMDDSTDVWRYKSKVLQASLKVGVGDDIRFDERPGPPLPPNWCKMQHSLTLIGFDKRLYLRCLHRNAMYGASADGEDDHGAPMFLYIPMFT